MFTWALAAISLLGTYLNLKKRRSGFALWIVSNISWFFYDLYIEQIAQAMLFLTYFFMAIWGFIAWSNNNSYEKSIGKVLTDKG